MDWVSMKYVKQIFPVLILSVTSCALHAQQTDDLAAASNVASIKFSSNTFGEQRVTPQGFLPPIKPVIDIPMRDPSVMLGPDGYYYMVGTQPPDGDTDFWHPYNGIRLFRSPDLIQWTNLGYVYQLKQNGTWQLKYKPGNLLPSFIPDHAHPKPTIWAPDLYYINGNWWMPYALAYNGWGTVNGMLKSTSGRPTGPYVEVGTGPITTKIDPGLFQDDDGKVYYVWCNGEIALLNAAMDALAEKPHLAVPSNADQVAFEGAALRKINGRYYMQAAGDGGHPRDYHGFSTYDTYVASSDNIYGPYGPNYVAIRNGGHNVFFKGKNGQWWATFFGWNPINPFNEKPAILPIELDEYAHVQPYYDQFTILSPDSRVKGVNWSYTFTTPTKDWAQPEYDDSQWNSAQGGFGDNVISSAPVPVRTLWPTTDIWLRRHFTLPQIKDSDPKISLDIFNTGPVKVYINGVLAYSASNHQQYYTESHPLSPEATKALIPGGDNVIAIHSTSNGERFIDAGLRLFTHKKLVPLATAKPVGHLPLLVDLGKEYAVTRTDTYFNTPGLWHQYLIEYSSDDVTWHIFFDSRKRKVVGDPCYTDVYDNGISADHVNARYMRLTVTDSDQPGQPLVMTVKKFCVFGHVPVDDPDLALGKTVQASSADERYPASNAVDGYWGTQWRARGNLPQWLTVDLGKVQTIHECKTWFGSEGLIYNYQIETSTNDETWTLFADRSVNEQPADPCYVDYAKAFARYVRLTELGKNDDGPVDLLDFKVYGASTPIPPAQPDPRSSLVGHWKLDEMNGQIAADVSSNHDNGTLKGACVWTSKGRLNGALELQGGTVMIPRGVGDTFTLAFWIKTTNSVSARSWKKGECLISSGDQRWGVSLLGSTLALGLGDYTVRATDAINDGKWHHCAVTRAQSGTVRIVIDGNPQITVEVPPSHAAADSGLIFGDKQFKELLDDVYLFRQPLNDVDLALIATPPATLVGKWTFKEHAGDESPDLSGHGNDARFFGKPVWLDEGINGASIAFGKNQSYGEIKRPVKNDFTISFWIKTTQTGPERPWNEGAWLVNGEMPGDTDDFGTSLSGGRFVFGTGAPDTSVASKTRVNDGRWHNCVATRRKVTGSIQVYVDGKLEKSVIAGKSSLTAPNVLRLGSTGDHHFAGALSDLQIYDGVLDAAEIADLYQKGLAAMK